MTKGCRFRLMVQQFSSLGIGSVSIVAVTSLFVGMAFAVQVVRELIRFGAPDMVGGVIALSIWRELGPLLTAVVLAGRVGASITAEIGAMKVNEQIAALNVMGQDSVDYLVIPRFVALVICSPLLVALADIMGFIGGLFIAELTSPINYMSYLNSASVMLNTFDITSGLIKSTVFASIIAGVANFNGLSVRYGAQHVGRKTQSSVVISLITIFIANFIMSSLFFST